MFYMERWVEVMCIYVAQGIVPFDNLADSAEKCGDVLAEREMDDVIQGVRIVNLP